MNKKNYSVINNLIYVTKQMIHTDRLLIVILFLGTLVGVASEYALIYLPKAVVGLIVNNQDTLSLLRLLAILVSLIIVARVFYSWSTNQKNVRFGNVRMNLLLQKMHKSNQMRYETLENPEILDLSELAHNAVSSPGYGVEGLMNRVYAIISDLAKMMLLIGVLATLNPIFIVIILALSFLHYYFFNRNIKNDRLNTWDGLASKWRKLSYYRHITSDFSAGKDIRLMNLSGFIEEKQKKENEEANHLIHRSKILWAKFGIFSNSINALMELLVYGLLVIWFIKGKVTIVNFTYYASATFAFFQSLNGLLYGVAITKRFSMHTNDYRSFMEFSGQEEPPSRLITDISSFDIEFHNVSFRYPNQDKDALSNISLKIPKHEKLAIVGINGAGKTTLVKLLLRLYEPTSGLITIDNIPIQSFPIEDYFTLFSPLFQEVELYAFPILQNVSMKKTEETDLDLVANVIQKAGLSPKIEQLPKGLNTELLKILYKDGTDFSGGERQKLALSRALYKKSPMVVLDEPTSALDALAEYDLYMKFNDLVKSRTALYISHRLSSTRFCDKIILLDEGKIIEEGTHQELIEKQGKYAEMYQLQAQYYVDGEDHEN